LVNSHELTSAPLGIYPKNLIKESVFKNEFIIFLQNFIKR
jgi:hypothetical protein